MRFGFIVGLIFRAIVVLISLPSSVTYAQSPFAERLDGYFSVSNADIYRGVNRNNHALSAMVGMRYQLSEAWSLGAKLNRTQFPSGPNSFADEIEFSHFLAWSKVLHDGIELQARFTRYTYPGSADSFFEYDYNELRFSLMLPKNIYVSLAATDTSFSFANGEIYGEIGWRKMLPGDLEFSVAWGGVDSQTQFLPDMAYWDAGVSRAFGEVVVDVRYHDSPTERLWIGRESVNQQWALSLTTAW